MGEKLWKEIELRILNQIYENKGGMRVCDLFSVLEAGYGLSEELFDEILERLVENGDCKKENVFILNNTEMEVVFITSKGVECLGEKKDISIKKILANKITYELKCEGCATYSEWLDKNREKLVLENNITGIYANALAATGGVLLAKDDTEEINELLEIAIEKVKNRTEKYPKLRNVIDVSIVMAIYEKLLELIGKDNFVEEAKKANKLIESIMPDRHNAVDSFL